MATTTGTTYSVVNPAPGAHTYTVKAVVAGALSAASNIQPATFTGTVVAPTTFTRPSGSGFQRYEDLYVSGDDLSTTLTRVTTGNAVTFPVGTFSASDFVKGYKTAIYIPKNCGGIWGSGPGDLSGTVAGTYFTMPAYSSTQPAITSGTTPYRVMNSTGSTVPQTFGQFQVQGSEQGHNYHGLTISTPNTPASLVVQDLLITGWAGSSNAPPGECFGIEIEYANGHHLLRVEADGRRADGVRYGSSPMTCEFTNGFTWTDCYSHHSISGMCTFYHVANGNTYNLKAQYHGTGSGRLNGSCINHEMTAGMVHHNANIYFDRSTGNSSFHISHSNDAYSDAIIGDITYGACTLLNPTWNDAWGDGKIRFQSFATEQGGGAESLTVPPVALDANGNVIPYIWYH